MQTIPSFEPARVLVIGDIMLDRYWHGDTGRISPEAPVPVVRIAREEARLGGAANVALNLAAVGAQVNLIGVVGDDEPGQRVQRMLSDAGVHTGLVVSRSCPTIAKLRVVSRNQQLIRLDFEESFAEQAAADIDELGTRYEQALADWDVVICSDYGKGTLARVGELIAAARAAGKPVLVDPKGTDWARYRQATLITPNLAELSAVTGEPSSDEDLAARAASLRESLALEALLVTRSERGMTLFHGEGDTHLPALAREVFDVTGAGDTVIALLGAGLGAGLALPDAANLANLGAGVVVGKLGTATVSRAELRRAARTRHADEDTGVLDAGQLQQRVEEARAHGERVVMTNGCFDLLHPGHVRYLEAARELGDWLVVAVNDDASVQRLKGDGRPINTLADRMEVLRGLGAVDWVTSFGEDTPAALIERVLPDVLVKGGDYRPEDIAGADAVLAAGGEVRVLEFVEGHSTSGIVERVARGG